MENAKVITMKELKYNLDKVGCCNCQECEDSKRVFLEWYGMKHNMMIESIVKAVRTILEVREFRYAYADLTVKVTERSILTFRT